MGRQEAIQRTYTEGGVKFFEFGYPGVDDLPRFLDDDKKATCEVSLDLSNVNDQRAAYERIATALTREVCHIHPVFAEFQGGIDKVRVLFLPTARASSISSEMTKTLNAFPSNTKITKVHEAGGFATAGSVSILARDVLGRTGSFPMSPAAKLIPEGSRVTPMVQEPEIIYLDDDAKFVDMKRAIIEFKASDSDELSIPVPKNNREKSSLISFAGTMGLNVRESGGCLLITKPSLTNKPEI